MGWSTGSLLMSDIIKDLKEILHHDPETRKEVYMLLIEKFEDNDCDTLDECIGEDDMYKEAYLEMHPDLEYEEDYENEYIDDDYESEEE